MPFLLSILRVLRKGRRPQRLQAWAGLLLVGLASVYVIVWVLWDFAIALLAFVVGGLLLRQSLRQPSS